MSTPATFLFEFFDAESFNGPGRVVAEFTSTGTTLAEALKPHLGSPDLTSWALGLFNDLGFSNMSSPHRPPLSKEDIELAKMLLDLASGSIETETLETLFEELMTDTIPNRSRLYELQVWKNGKFLGDCVPLVAVVNN